ncbi:MAG: hypothetical protein HYW47_02495 [Deltaproteobacteria bacterium]|nr:hypothetical protein [Deltaproteobacteria bacterium]
MKKLFLSLGMVLCVGVLFSCGPVTPKKTSSSSGTATTTSGSPFIQPATTSSGTTTTPTTTTTTTSSPQVLKNFSTTMWIVGSATTVISNVILEVLVTKTPLINYASHIGIESFVGIRNTYNGNFMATAYESPTSSTLKLDLYGFAPYDYRWLSAARYNQYFRVGTPPIAEYHFTCVQDLSKVDQKGQRLFMNRVAIQTSSNPSTWERTEVILRFLNSRTGVKLHEIALRGDMAEDSPYIRIACSEFEL